MKQAAPHTDAAAGLTEAPVELCCRIVCRLLVFALVAIIDMEIVTRNLFDFSFYLSDEYGGYLLVGLTFLSLPLCVQHGSFHRVTFLLGRVPPRGREALLLAFDLLALLFVLAVLWQVALLVESSWSLQTDAPTLLRTPLWIPQLVMPIGLAATSVTLARSLMRQARRVRGTG